MTFDKFSILNSEQNCSLNSYELIKSSIQKTKQKTFAFEKTNIFLFVEIAYLADLELEYNLQIDWQCSYHVENMVDRYIELISYSN